MRSVQVTGRTKSVYSTWTKLQRLHCGIDGIHDLTRTPSRTRTLTLTLTLTR